jgi:hypothetical protein
MPKLVDTTIRLLSQEPLAGGADGGGARARGDPRRRRLRCLEVSGGGVFDAAVAAASRARGSGSARSRRARRRRSGSRSAAASSSARGRSAPTSCAASSRAPPRTASTSSGSTTAQRRLEPARGGEAITSAGGASTRARLQPGRTARRTALVEQARKLPELGATRVLIERSDGALSRTVRRTWSRRSGGERAPVGSTCQGAAGTGLAPRSRRRGGADSIATPSTRSR